MSSTTGLLRYMARSRLLRGAFIGLIASGVGASMTTPQLTLFLTSELHLSESAAGLYYLTNLSAPVFGFIIGSISDHGRSRMLVFRLCTAVGAIGWLAMAFATQTWMPFVINALLLGVAGAGAAQLQAVVRDELNRHPTPFDHQVVAAIRMSMSIGWIIGPVVGAPLGAILGLRALLAVTAVLMLAGLVPLIGVGLTPALPRTDTRPVEVVTSARMDQRTPIWPLIVFTAIYVLIMSGEVVKLAYLPLYMNNQLHLTPLVRGAIIGFQPLVEVLLMPLAAAIAARRGVAPVLFVGGAAAVGAHICYAMSAQISAPIVLLIAGQVFMSAGISSFGVLGITVAQRLQPDRIGLASSVYLSSFAINGAVGGLIGSVGVVWLGQPHLFWIPAVTSAVGTVALIVFNAARPLKTGAVARDVNDVESLAEVEQ
jgi:MFS transporter, SET family, sugar efflux transporter